MPNPRWIPRQAQAWLLFLIVFGGVVARLYHVDDPLFGFRPLDTAAIARNFYEHGMHSLYPQIDWRGNSPGYVESEFQIYTYVVALLYHAFGVHEVIGRLVSIVVYALSALLLFAFTRRLFNGTAGWLAVLFYSVSALSYAYTKSFQPDALLALASLAGIYYFWVWSENGRLGALVLSAAAVCVATLIKPTSLYLGLPLLYLAHRSFGWRLLRRPELWAFALAVLVPPLLWYRHSYHLWLNYGNTFGVFGGWVKYEMFPPDLSLARHAVKEILIRLALLIATPVGLVLLPIGFFSRPPKQNYVLHGWCVGFGIAVLIAARAMQVHDYYQLPLVFLASAWMAHGVVRLLNWQFASPWVLRTAAMVLCLSVVAFGIWRCSLKDEIPQQEWNRIAFAHRVAQLTEPSALVIMVRPYRGLPDLYQHRTSQGEFLECDPVDFYRSHRIGWSLDETQAQPALIEELRRRGARYLATAFPEVLQRHPDMKAKLDTAYTPREVAPGWAIYLLEPPAESHRNERPPLETASR